MRTVVTHGQYQRNYDRGFDAAKADVARDEFEKSRDSFNENFPIGSKFSGLDDYYFKSGYIDGLVTVGWHCGDRTVVTR